MSQNLYPFTSKKTIQTRLAESAEFRREAMVCLYDMQTEHEKNTKSTLNKNRVGFMSSHAVRGTLVAEKIKKGEPLSDDDQATVDKIAPRYSRQIALHFRAREIAANPQLAEVAEMFSANRNLPQVAAEVTETEVEVDEILPAGVDSEDLAF